jgi:hemin uptake protein HemP
VTEPDAARTGVPVAAASRVRMSSRDLFRGRREIVILHAGHEYLLRITRADKLILTK